MFLLVGQLDPAFAECLRNRLEGKGSRVQAIRNPFDVNHRFRWRFDSAGSSSVISLEDGLVLRAEAVHGVVVGRSPQLTGPELGPEKLAFAQAEIDSALLGWLRHLSCTVINRYSPYAWYARDVPPFFWSSIVNRSGLPPTSVQSVKINGVDCDARKNRLTSSREPVYDEDDDQQVGPYELYVIGRTIVWGDQISQKSQALEAAAMKFASLAELSFVRFTFAVDSTHQVRMIDVFPQSSESSFRITRSLADRVAELLLNVPYQA
jgi:hypothetical protein